MWKRFLQGSITFSVLLIVLIIFSIQGSYIVSQTIETSVSVENSRDPHQTKSYPIVESPYLSDKDFRKPLDLEFVKISPYTASESFPFLVHAVQSLNFRLQEIEKIARSKGLPIRHVFQGAYGSGFLRNNLIGNDLDYSLAIHLGTVPVSYKDIGSASKEILARLEQYLEVFYDVILSMTNPNISIMQWRLLDDGHLKNRDLILQKLNASLLDVINMKKHVLLVDSLHGLRVPTTLSVDESYIYETTRIILLSNQIQYLDWMFPGIREFSVMFHFFVDLECETEDGKTELRRNISVSPTFVPSGNILPMTDYVLGTVPVGTESAALLSNVLHDKEEVVQARFDMLFAMLGEIDRNLSIGMYLKSLKRLHQAFDAIAPVFPDSFKNELDSFLIKALQNEDLLLCEEISELSAIAAKVLRNPVLINIYYYSKDLKRVLMQINQDLYQLERHCSKIFAKEIKLMRQYIVSLDKTMSSFPDRAEREKARKLLEELQQVARNCAGSFLPKASEIKFWKEHITQRLALAGFKPLPVYGMSDGTIGIIKEDLQQFAPLKDLNQELKQMNAPDFFYRFVEKTEIPKDKRGNQVGSSKVLWLRPSPGPEEDVDYKKILSVLYADTDNFVYIDLPDKTDALKAAKEAFLQRFGEDGVQAWDSSTTGGNALIALLGVEDTNEAEQLLQMHLDIIARSTGASQIMPPLAEYSLAYPLDQAFRRTSERILEALAIGRANKGKQGLTPHMAMDAQRQMLDLMAAFQDVANNEAAISLTKIKGGSIRHEIVCKNAHSKLVVGTRPKKDDYGQARIKFKLLEVNEKPLREYLMIRLDFDKNWGAAYDLQFTSPRLNRGIHGILSYNRFSADHHFREGIPPPLTRKFTSEERRQSADTWSDYVETIFMPQTIKDLNTLE